MRGGAGLCMGDLGLASSGVSRWAMARPSPDHVVDIDHLGAILMFSPTAGWRLWQHTTASSRSAISCHAPFTRFGISNRYERWPGGAFFEEHAFRAGECSNLRLRTCRPTAQKISNPTQRTCEGARRRSRASDCCLGSGLRPRAKGAWCGRLTIELQRLASTSGTRISAIAQLAS